MAQPLDHLTIPTAPEGRPFKSVRSAPRGASVARQRQPHGQRLLGQIRSLIERSKTLAGRRAALGLPASTGLTIAIEVRPPGSLPYEQIEWKRDGTELLSVTQTDTADIVVVYVPDGRLAAFEQRVERYLAEDTKWNKPKHAALVNAVETFRAARFEELWTDDSIPPPPPASTEAQWFQLWLRASPEGPAATREAFVQAARTFEIEVERGFVPFPGRVVIAVRATRARLELAVELLGFTAEIRAVAPVAEFFLSDLTPADQVDWVRNLEQRVQSAPADGPYVALLDTGVAQAHPLIQAHLDAADLHAADPAWATVDFDGHGTQMAGIALYGDLVHPLASSAACPVPHRLESVVLLPPPGQAKTHLYGWVTANAVDAVESAQPSRRRVFAMMSTTDGTTSGRPSEWSATIDRLALGSDGALEPSPPDEEQLHEPRRLFVLAGGNIPWNKWGGYPGINTLETLQNPAQAWNALTVGAYTERVSIDAVKWPSLTAIAPHGGLSPCSSTSRLWHRAWPYKPDVVAEGGNGAIDSHSPVVGPESLRLLTANRDMTTALLAETGDTSAATAEVARLCAHLAARYPGYWPETLRALVVHGARYSGAMLQGLPAKPQMQDKISLLRHYGHGAVSADNALNSTRHRPTLVIQGQIQPYRQAKDGVRLNEMNLHDLPWPAGELLAMGETPVQMRVTLSYFVEPNPSQRGWQSKFRYQSHGLRFAVRGATETLELFSQRINKIERELADGDVESMTDPDTGGWALGTKLQSNGSIHSDTWSGTAAALAQKSHLAVYPVGGWWKDWKEAGRALRRVHYALVVSLEVAESVDVDLYTPIAVQIGVPVSVPIET